MAPRADRKGSLCLSLVTSLVALYPSTRRVRRSPSISSIERPATASGTLKRTPKTPIRDMLSNECSRSPSRNIDERSVGRTQPSGASRRGGKSSHLSGLRRGDAAAAAERRRRFSQAGPAPVDPWPFRPRARHSGSLFNPAIAAERRTHDDSRQPGHARSRRPDARRPMGRGKDAHSTAARSADGRPGDRRRRICDLRLSGAPPRHGQLRVLLRKPGPPSSPPRPPRIAGRAGRPGAQAVGGRKAGDAA
jgi:hypothetical protein